MSIKKHEKKIVNIWEIEERNEEMREKVLKKHAEDVDFNDLAFIDPEDPLFMQLPYKFKKIIKARYDAQVIFEQMGSDFMTLLLDPDVNEINLNQDGYLWVDSFGKGKSRTEVELDKTEVEAMFGLVADNNSEVITAENPIISTNLPSRERITCLMGEVVKGTPVFSLRKPPSRIFPLENYVESGKLTQQQKEALISAIEGGANILVVGGVGSGKTTFCNGLLNELMDTSYRVLLIEDTPELICDCPDKVELTTTKYVTLVDLLRVAMRLNGDIVVVGELRKGEDVAVLLKIWNSGSKGGVSTIHADDAQSGLMKLNQYCQEENLGDQKEEILQAVNVVVCLKKKKDSSNYVHEVKFVKGFDYDKKEYILKDLEVGDVDKIL